jgi:hypothetical protein
MIMVNSAPARHVAHHPTKLSAAHIHKRRTTVRSYTTVGADTAWASTRPTATPPRPRRPPCRTQPVLASPRRLGQSPPSCPGHGRPCPGPSRRGTGVPSARSAPTVLAPQAGGGSTGTGLPRHGQARLPRPAGLAATPKRVCREPWLEPTRAPPVTAAVPPHERFLRSRTCYVPGLHTPRRCPGRINLPEPARVKPSWRTRGDHVENAPASAPGRFAGLPSSPPQLSWA